MRRCLYDSCTTAPGFNFEGSKKRAYCKKHAKDGMVNVHAHRCSHDSCTRISSFNFEGSRTRVYCKQHAKDGMVVVGARSCSHGPCKTGPSYNVVGSNTAAYCKKHAEGSMVNVVRRRCLYHSCMKQPICNVEGSRTGVYCQSHAGAGMVDVCSKRCSRPSCTMRPRWGMLTDGEATVCVHHMSDLLGGPVIDFVAKCKVVGCRKLSRWGLDGKQPTYCPSHGPLTAGLVCTVGKNITMTGSRSPSYSAARAPSFHVKPECTF